MKKKLRAATDRRTSSQPNYSYWATCNYLSPMEATALSFGSDPDEFGPETGRSREQALLFPQFRNRLRAIERLESADRRISLRHLLTWMDEHKLQVPAGLRAAVPQTKPAVPDDSERLRRELNAWKLKYNQLNNKKDERSRDRLIVGLAMIHHGWEPKKARGGGFAGNIQTRLKALATRANDEDVWQKEIEVHSQTIRKQIEIAYRRLAELDDGPLVDFD